MAKILPHGDGNMDKQKVDIVFFSRTGNTKKVAEIIFQELSQHTKTDLIEIQPKRNYPYLIWLGLSCVPNCGVGIKHKKITSDLVFLCFPKWTINCPPIAAFLRRVDLTQKMVYLVIIYGGFDEKRYARCYKEKTTKLCGEVKDVLLVKRSEIEKGNFAGIKNWLERVLEETENKKDETTCRTRLF